MIIQIYGPGCSMCKMLEKQAQNAVSTLGLDAKVEKISDAEMIMNMGIMVVPALVINGEVKSSGKLLSEKNIIKLITGEIK